jgi:hypothetical protein
MAKSPTIPTIPTLPITPAVQVPDPVTLEPAQARPDLAPVATSEPPTLIASSKPGPRLARLVPQHGFPIRHFNNGIVFYPGQPSAEIPVDAWLENQIKQGILKEV